MAGNQDLAKLVVKLEAQTSQFQSELEKTKRQLSKFDSDVSKLASKIDKSIGVAVAGAATGLAFAVKQSLDTADEIGKMAQKVGIGTEALSKLNYAASLSDVSTEQLQAGLVKLSKSAVEAAAGTGNAATAFKALGVSVKNADGSLKGTDQLFTELAEAFSNFADGPEKAAAAVEIFGKSGADLIPLLNAGRQGIEDAGVELQKFGGVITPQAAKAAEEFNDNLTRLKTAGSGVSTQLAGQLAPALADITGKLVQFSTDTEAVGKAADGAKVIFKGLTGSVIVLSNAFQIAGDSVGATAAIIGSVLRGDFAGAMEIARARVDDFKTDWNDIVTAFDDAKPVIKSTGETAATAVTNATQPTLNYAAAVAEAKNQTKQAKDITDAWALSLLAAQEIADEVAAMDQEKKDTQSRQDDIGLDAAAEIEAEIEAMRKAEEEKTAIAEEEAYKRRVIQDDQLSAGLDALGFAAEAASAMGKKGFKAFKAFAIAQALVDTYASAVATYKSLATIPVVGPGLAVAGAAAAVAAGLSRVAQIKAMEPSGYATGGVIPGGEQVIKVNEKGTESVVSNPALMAAANAINDPDFWQSNVGHAAMPEMEPTQIVVNNNVPGVDFKMNGNILTADMTADLANVIGTMLATQVTSGRGALPSAIGNKFGLQQRQVR